jgi:hypothetical protein
MKVHRALLGTDLDRGSLPLPNLTRPYHRPLRQDGPRPDEGACSHPAAITDHNRLRDQVEPLASEVMTPGAYKGALREAHIGADPDGGQAQNQHLISNPDMIADLQLPGKRDVHPAADHHADSDLGAKQPQSHHLDHRRHRKPRRETKRSTAPPEDFLPEGCSAGEFRVGKLRKLDQWLSL